jgi:hypothetical protein
MQHESQEARTRGLEEAREAEALDKAVTAPTGDAEATREMRAFGQHLPEIACV